MVFWNILIFMPLYSIIMCLLFAVCLSLCNFWPFLQLFIQARHSFHIWVLCSFGTSFFQVTLNPVTPKTLSLWPWHCEFKCVKIGALCLANTSCFPKVGRCFTFRNQMLVTLLAFLVSFSFCFVFCSFFSKNKKSMYNYLCCTHSLDTKALIWAIHIISV